MNLKTSRGFSLLEIVIASLVISIGGAGIFCLFIVCNRLIGESGRRYVASSYARQVAETLKVYVSASNNTPPGAGNAFTNSNFGSINLNSNMTLGGITYNCNYNVAGVTNAPTLRQVNITVNWTEP